MGFLLGPKGPQEPLVLLQTSPISGGGWVSQYPRCFQVTMGQVSVQTLKSAVRSDGWISVYVCMCAHVYLEHVCDVCDILSTLLGEPLVSSENKE